MDGLLPIFKGPAEASRLLTERLEGPVDDLADTTPYQGDLEGYIDDLYRRFSDHRRNSGIDALLLDSLRAVDCEYAPDKLSAINKTGGSTIYMGVSAVKARAAVSWLLDIYSNEEDKTWGIRPSPMPTLSPADLEEITFQAQSDIQQFIAQVQQSGQQVDPSAMQDFKAKLMDDIKDKVLKKASDKAKSMETLIHDQMVEGGWTEAFSAFVKDLAGSCVGVLKGPTTRMRRRKKWMQDPTTGQMVLELGLEPVMTFDRVSPFNAFPSPTAVDFDGDFIERYRLSRSSIVALQDLEGYNSLAIQAVLAEFDALATPSQLEVDRSERILTKQDTSEYDTAQDSVEALEAWVAVPGDKLISSQITQDADGAEVIPEHVYDMCIIKVGHHIIYSEFNRDPLRRKPYYKMGWDQIPGSFWYRSVPLLMTSLQDLANASTRSMADNMSLASGPQVAVNDVSRLPPGEDVTSVYPRKIWQFMNKGNSNVPPIAFFQPASNVPELMSLYERVVQWADDWTGIPAYQYGTPSASAAGRTSSGLSMLMSNAAKGIKRVILDVDKFVFKPLIERIYDENMMFYPDPSVKGDMQIETTGAVAIMVKEQMSERRMAFLQATANPIDLKIMGHGGRAKVLREAAKTLELAGQEVVMDDVAIEKVLNQEQQQQAQAQQQQAELQQAQMQADLAIKQGQLELQKQELNLKSQELLQVKAPVAGAKLQSAKDMSDSMAVKNYMDVTKPQPAPKKGL